MQTPKTVDAGHVVKRADASTDAGSVTPLVLGMTLILLVLSMGIVAAGDVWLARDRLQNRCDGAALAASYAADVPGSHRRLQAANTAAIEYLSDRQAQVGVSVELGADTVTANCWSTDEITFGWMFLKPTLRQTVDATTRLRTQDW